MRRRKRVIFLLVALTALALLIYVFRYHLLVPRWKIIVTDSGGRPLAGATVVRHFPSFATHEVQTDAGGVAKFGIMLYPRRSFSRDYPTLADDPIVCTGLSIGHPHYRGKHMPLQVFDGLCRDGRLTVRLDKKEICDYVFEKHPDILAMIEERLVNGTAPRETLLEMLRCAVISNNGEVISFLLPRFPDLAPKTDLHWEHPSLVNALHLACRHGNEELTRLLLDKGMYRYTKESLPDSTPLILEAVAGNSPQIVQWLLDAGEDPLVSYPPNVPYPDTPISRAIELGPGMNVEMFEILLEKTLQAGGKGFLDEAELLHRAARHSTPEVIRRLIPLCDINRRDNFESTPLFYAVTRSSVCNAPDSPIVVLTPLDGAPANRAAIVRMLLEAGAEVNLRNSWGRTLLCEHFEIVRDDVETVRLLLEHGENPMGRIGRSATPLHIAVSGGTTRVIEQLLKHGADINATTDDGTTPLHSAAWDGDIDIIRFLIEHGADPDLRNAKGRKPLSWSMRRRLRSLGVLE